MKNQYRQIISYDSGLGHKYVPNLVARMRYGNSGYFIHTDKFGFRNTNTDQLTEPGIVVIGDSYAAGDGISNDQRFSDLLQEKFNIPVYNLAVSGYGIDQQLLAYQKHKLDYPHHTVIFCPHQDDLFRNMVIERVGIDKNNGEKIMISKPKFVLKNGNLVLENVPVPKEHSQAVLQEKNTAQKNKLVEKVKSVSKRLKKITGQQNKNSYPETADTKSDLWQLADALIQKLLEEIGEKKLIIVPFTYTKVFVENEVDEYSNVFNKYKQTDRVDVINFTDQLRTEYGKKDYLPFLPICGHFTSEAHVLLSEKIASSPLFPKADAKIISKKKLNNDSYYLGISCFYHDSAAAILKNGVLIAAAQEERFTRKKHDKNFPENAIHYCLEAAGINGEELSGVSYYDKESLTIERVLHNSIQPGINTEKYWENAGKYLVTKLKLKQQLKEKINYSGSVVKYEHHLTHAASAFYLSPFEDAAILILDGVGEWACSTIAVGKGKEIKILKQQFYPHSIGLLYSAFTYFCGFKVNSGEYKLMGLAPYGKPKYLDTIKNKLVELREDGSLFLNMDYFSFLDGEKMTNEKFSSLFDGPERKGESRITQREMDLAASIQAFTEEVVLKMAHYAYELSGKKNLVMAGGVALNCVANGKLFDNTPFTDFFFQPASGDAGGAPGAALLQYYSQKTEDSHQESIQKHSYLGPSFSDSEMEAFLETKNIIHHKFKSNRNEVISEWLSADKVIGYFDGRMEFGPRALGARSIIGNPLSSEMQSKLNLKIKFRESFRPFAPIYAEEKTKEYFDFDKPSPYMLVVRSVKKDLCFPVNQISDQEDLIAWVNQKRSVLPSITHVDYSARLQSVNKNENPVFHDLLKSYGKKTGWEILVNTSFNVRGEPIVCTPLDAFKCFMRTHMDVLVLGNYYLLKEDQPEWNEKENWEELYELD